MLIIKAGAREYRVGGRVAAMILWLLEREETEHKINTLYNYVIQFNVRGCKIKPSFQEFADDIEASQAK